MNKTGLFTSMMNSVSSFFGKEISSEYACLNIENISKNEPVQMFVFLPSETNQCYRLIIISVTGDIVEIEFTLHENQLFIKRQTTQSLQFN